jgi:16S rRNA (cytosine1402-N4)-methyltransferase
MINNIHQPVMLTEVIDHLVVTRSGTYLDATCGFGGHTELILKKLSSGGKVIAMDQDQDAINFVKDKFTDQSSLKVIKGRFGNLKELLESNDLNFKFNGILADLGMSSFQLDNAHRGFSFQNEGPLDMRMDQKTGVTAQIWINSASEDEISKVLWQFGEEKYSRKIARAIIAKRISHQIETTQQLTEIIVDIKKNTRSKRRQHHATKTFQAIRIYINQEIDQLEMFLNYSLNALQIGGRLCVISFHSLEDRMVKRFFRNHSRLDPNLSKLPNLNPEYLTDCKIVARRIKPSQKEIDTNPRARSAVLRVVEKVK